MVTETTGRRRGGDGGEDAPRPRRENGKERVESGGRPDIRDGALRVTVWRIHAARERATFNAPHRHARVR